MLPNQNYHSSTVLHTIKNNSLKNQIADVLVYSKKGSGLKQLAKEAHCSKALMKGIIHEFQHLRVARNLEIIKPKDISYYYPTCYQFSIEQIQDICSTILDKPKEHPIRKLQLIQFYYKGMFGTAADITEIINVSKNTVLSFKKEFTKIMESQDNKVILDFGESLGIIQAREPVGTIQTLECAYFWMLNTELARQWYYYQRYGKIDENSLLLRLWLLRDCREGKEMHFNKLTEKEQNNSLSVWLTYLKTKIKRLDLVHKTQVYYAVE